ncbi:MAG TPA: M14 family metallopeptidase [Longimicrobiales bacterium]|nr:M14 family metallopeptidase [Longimicrobiales bacterium]
MSTRRSVGAVLTALALFGSMPAAAAAQSTLPSPRDVLGYERGARFTPGADVVRYMEALAAAAPDRVRVERYGETGEGRPLIQVVVARPEVMARLDDVLARNRRLADPSLGESQAQQIASSNPAVVYLSYGVHGNESSSSEAAMWTAWDLARGAPSVAGVLDSVLVVIDPVVNPDGRNRYVNWYRQARGAEPNPHPASREHREPWPGGRLNHWLFDLNRDWAWATQPETRERLATWGRWTPQVHVDFHEMSPRSTYFFFPPTAPVNPIFPATTLQWMNYFGKANAAAFDSRGWQYYSAESFDLFYPGYGDSWPSLEGATGMTYEQAGGGGAGLVVDRPDGTQLTLAARSEHHWVAGEATVKAAAAAKTRLLTDFAAYHRHIADGLSDYLLVPSGIGERARALVGLLQDEGIEVERAGRAFRADAQANTGFDARGDFPAGTYLVRAQQRRGRLAAALLEPEALLKANFSYDISAWSLPYAYGVAAYSVGGAPDAGWQPAEKQVRAFREPAAGASPAAASLPATEPYGYLVKPTLEAWAGMVRFMAAGGRGTLLEKAFRNGAGSWPRGTIFLPRQANDSLTVRLARSGLTALATPVQTGWTEDGPELGTEESLELRLPRVAVLTGEGTSASSYGAHWFFLEQTLGLPFDALSLDGVSATTLASYDVVVAPELRRPGDGVVDALKQWVDAGGTLVAVGSAAQMLGEPIAGIKVRQSREGRDSTVERGLETRAQREQQRWREDVPGTVLPVTLDPGNPLAFGVAAASDDTRLFVLQTGTRAFEPDPSAETVAYFPVDLKAVSGVIGDVNLKRLSRAAWLVTKSVRRGRVILFAGDPMFRQFWYSAFLPYVNALLVGPNMGGGGRY